MVMTIPQSVKCSRCGRCFPSGAVMQSGGKTIPALVVPEGVGSVQEAIDQATCQVCLERAGSPARGLKRVLEQLGVSETMTVPVGRHRREPVPDPGAAVGRRRSFAPPSLADVTVVVPGARREYTPSRPVRMSKPLPAPHPQQRGGEREDRRRGNKTVLEAVAKALAVRREAERQDEIERRTREREERQRRFDRSVRVLRLMLLRTRTRARTQDIDERNDTFDRKLRLAADSDALQRGKNAIMQLVGTSVEELVDLSRLVYLTMSVEPDELAGARITRLVPRAPLPMTPHRPAHPYEQVMVDVFPGGRRSEHWGIKGRSTVAMLYEVAVMRPIHEDPVPNPKLSGSGNDPTTHPSSSPLGVPKLIYPQGGEFGGTHEVRGSTKESLPVFPWEERPQGWAACALASWLDDHQDLEIQCNGRSLNVASFMALSMEDIVMDTDESQDGELDLEPEEEESIHRGSELPSTT